MNIEEPAELIAYLRRTERIGPREQPRVTVLGGGVSNRTVLVEREDGESWVLKQALPKLRVPVDWFCSPERIVREALGLRWLEGMAPAGAITPLVFEDPDEHLLAMRAVPQPHENWKNVLLAGNLDPGHVDQFAALAAAIHSRGREVDLPREFEDRGYFEALRLEPYYSYTAEQAPESGPFLRRLIADTLATRNTLVHGDYSPKNILVHRGRLVLLDHEVVHIGDPAFDIGFSMAHLLSKAHHLAERRDGFAEAALRYWNRYFELAGGVVERCVRHSLGCLAARVRGRSQLEYLSPEEKARQCEVVLQLMAAPPDSMEALVHEFVRRLAEVAPD
jgi:tRNA A-37 threonylcarbamoyl transferase component Bud32